jgi:hypothetical protein
MTTDDISNNHDASVDSTLRVMKERIRPEVFQEFYELLDSDELVPECYPASTSMLLNLAKSGTIESLRKLEKMNVEGKLSGKESEFAILAMNFCRFKVENELLDVEMDMISGGLGGSDNRLRYYTALTSTEGTVSDHIEDIERVFRKVLKRNDSILEKLTDHGFYLSVLILGSLNYAIGNILDEFFKECPYLSTEYYSTNVEIPTDDRIRDWLDGKLENETEYS